MPLGLTTSIRTLPSKPSPDHNLVRLLTDVDRLVDEVLYPAAANVDVADELPAANFRAIADLGLYGLVVDPERGGLGCDQAAVRAVFRRIGSGCGATAFAFAQHHGTVGSLLTTANEELRSEWLPRLVGEDLAGIGYAHVRRGGPPVLSAEPDGDGWILDGTAPWVTSWGFAPVFAIAARTPDGDLVWVLVPGRETDGLTAGPRFELMVFGATQTVPLRFSRYRVGPEAVLEVTDGGAWGARDRFLAARPNPMAVGIGDRALRLLAVKEPGLADELRPWWDQVADRAEDQCRKVDEGRADVAAVAHSRAEVLAGLQRLTTALVAALGGSAMERAHPAQRLAREALFYVVQAQSADGRAATLDRLAGRAADLPSGRD